MLNSIRLFPVEITRRIALYVFLFFILTMIGIVIFTQSETFTGFESIVIFGAAFTLLTLAFSLNLLRVFRKKVEEFSKLIISGSGSLESEVFPELAPLAKTIQRYHQELIESNNRLLAEAVKQNEAKKALQQSQELFSTVFANSPVMMAISRVSDKKYIEVNELFLKVLGYCRDEVINTNIYGLKITPDWSSFEKSLQEFYQKGELHSFETEILAKSGEVKSCLFFIQGIVYSGQLCMLFVIQDITELKLAAKHLEQLDRLNLIGEMAASMGHEIRNPMTTVRGFLQMLANKDTLSAEKEYFNLMIDELDRANGIISEYLTLAKNKPINLINSNLCEIITSIYPLIQADAYLNDIDVRLSLKEIPSLPLDEKEIRQLILNLARNGIEAMGKGGTLEIGVNGNKDEVVLYVADEGSGIEPAVIDKLGTPFQTTKENGTGLGLAVCYSIASRHNAEIQVETGPGGTTFFVRFMTGKINSSDNNT